MPEDHSSPLAYGFDHHYGYLCQGMAHTYYPPYLWRDDKKEPLLGNPPYAYGQPGAIAPGGRAYAHDLMAEDALRWVDTHRAEPFFLYLAFTIPHVSLQVPEDSLAEYRGRWPETPMRTSKHYANHETPRAAYAAMITRMDRDIGRLMDRLKALGLDDHTLVLFGSDNGAVFALSGTDPDFFRSNGPLRGYKQDLYEGGIRIPFIARWPGRIKPGTTSDFIGGARHGLHGQGDRCYFTDGSPWLAIDSACTLERTEEMGKDAAAIRAEFHSRLGVIARQLARELYPDGLPRGTKFSELEAVAGALGDEMARQLIEVNVQEQADDWPEEELGECPACGGTARKAPDQPRVLTTTRGDVAWKQRVGNCPRCRRAFFPSESSLGR
jgi:arylsulfatase A-like enzyme